MDPLMRRTKLRVSGVKGLILQYIGSDIQSWQAAAHMTILVITRLTFTAGGDLLINMSR